MTRPGGGLAGWPAWTCPCRRARVYASGQAHNTIQRATAVLGLGRAGTRRIACDARQRIDVAALRAAIAEDERDGVVPVAVVGTAGTTDTGAIDPHKWLATGAGCAATYVRDAGLLPRAFAQGAATYYQE